MKFGVTFGLLVAHYDQNYLITVVLCLIVHWYYATDLGAGSLAIDDCNTVDPVGFNVVADKYSHIKYSFTNTVVV